MHIGTICTRHVVTIDAQRSLTEAASLMRAQHVGTLVVTCLTARGTEVCGIVTDRDLVVDALARDPLETDIHVADLARTDLTMISENADLDDAVTAMHENGVRRLLVSNSDDRLCGLLSIDDVIQAFADQIAGLAKIIRSGKEREIGEHQPARPATHMPRFPAVGTAAWTRGAP